MAVTSDGERRTLDQIFPPTVSAELYTEISARIRSERGHGHDDVLDWADLIARAGRVGTSAIVLPESTLSATIVEVEATVKLDDARLVTFVLDVRGPEAVPLRARLDLDMTSTVDLRALARLGIAEAQRRVSRELGHVLGLLRPGQSSQFAVPRPGRSGHTEQQYALWARDYVFACEDVDHARRPIAHLVELNPGTTPALWRSRLAKAQKLGLLTGRPKGEAAEKAGRTAGGRLSAKAKRLLEEIGQ